MLLQANSTASTSAGGAVVLSRFEEVTTLAQFNDCCGWMSTVLDMIQNLKYLMGA